MNLHGARMEAVRALASLRKPIPSADPTRGPAELADAAREFEAFFLKVMLEGLRKTVTSGGLFTDDSMKGYQMLMDDALARRAAETGSFGLAEQIIRELGAK